MKKGKLLMVVLLCLVFGSSTVLGETVTGVAILDQGAGVRQLGMGEVATGLSDDASAMHYNPAGIATLKDIEFNVMYHQNILDTKNEAINFTYPLKRGIFSRKKGGLGIGILAYQGGDIEVILGTESGGGFLEESSEVVTAESDYQIGFCYSEEIAEYSGNTYAGVMVKWIQSTLVEEYRASAIGIDMGVLHKYEGLGLGISLQNIGTEMKFVEVGGSLPFTVRFGGSYEREINEIVKVAGGLDMVKVKNEDMGWNMGGECWIADMLGIRAGYKINSEDKVSIGASVRYKWIQLDYGYKITDTFDNTHQMAVTLRMSSPAVGKQAKLK